MNKIKTIYKLDLRLLFNRKTFCLLLFLLPFSILFIQDGINKYQSVVASVKPFQAYERYKTEQYQYYRQYGVYGIKILFVPSPQSIFFNNSCTITELTAIVDSGERLALYNSFKGKTLFAEKIGGLKDFSGIMLLFGSALMIFLGYQSFWHKDYLRFMSGVVSRGKLFFAIIFSRMLIIFLFLLVVSALAVIQLMLNGIYISQFPVNYLLLFQGLLFVIWIFFYLLGTLASSIKSRFTGLVVLITVWFCFIFGVPSVINSYIYSKAEKIKSDDVEKKTFTTLMGAEEAIKKEIGSVTPENALRASKLIIKYLDKDFLIIQKLEKSLEKEMIDNIRLYQGISLWIPSTFYLSSTNEISSKGYTSYIKFYQHIQFLRVQFVRFILGNSYNAISSDFKKLVNKNTKKSIKPFFKNEGDTIFKAQSSLPAFFLPGLFLMILYISGLAVISLYLFKRSLRV